MDTSNFRPELHVAQQSRRDKLRNHLNPYTNIPQLPYDPPGFCSDYPDPPDPHFGTWQSIPSHQDNINNNNTWVSVIRDNNINSYQNPLVNPALEVKPYNPNELYHNALQDLVSTSEGPGPWGGGGELLLLPAYADQVAGSRPPETRHWNGDHQYSNGQALSLSLSSAPLAERSHDDVGNFHSRDHALTNRAPGPLGPFTGYATILRSSRFLGPAQVLLEELCCVARPKHLEIGDKMIEEVRVSGGDLSSSFSIGFNGSREVEGVSGWLDSCRPESLHKKAKLLYMQEEVSKKYKQYQQQMQMVVSSFESVEGLGASTPYVSLALKMVSKHFRCLKTAITDQLKSIRNALGEEQLASPSTGDGRASMLKFFDQSSQKQKGTSNDNNNNNAGIIDGQHIWRPQRGLPERAVSILRAWLFDHFLHPYPTDTDKHMLATQTGLTRNQVSNWFINARVRLWKPMVEEIHMLETKAMDETCSDGKTTTNTSTGQCSNTVQTSGKYSSVDYPISASWNQEKRSRIEYGVQTGGINDGSLMGMVPAAHHQSVSLTLGLRQSAENGQRPQHYGGQFRRDFVG